MKISIFTIHITIIKQVEKSNSKQLTRHLSINSEDSNLTDGLKSSPSVSNYFENNDSPEMANRENYDFCTCWCQGWAEVHIRRPTGKRTHWMCFQLHMLLLFYLVLSDILCTILFLFPIGDTSWIMRLQNETCSTPYKNPMTDVSTLYQASVIQESMKLTETFEKMKKSSNDIPSNTVTFRCRHNFSKYDLLKLPEIFLA